MLGNIFCERDETNFAFRDIEERAITDAPSSRSIDQRRFNHRSARALILKKMFNRVVSAQEKQVGF